jgi:hypothetical protein
MEHTVATALTTALVVVTAVLLTVVGSAQLLGRPSPDDIVPIEEPSLALPANNSTLPVSISQVVWNFTNPTSWYCSRCGHVEEPVAPCEINSTVTVGGTYERNRHVWENATVVIPQEYSCAVNASVSDPEFTILGSNLPPYHDSRTGPIAVNVSTLALTPDARFQGSLEIIFFDVVVHPPLAY